MRAFGLPPLAEDGSENYILFVAFIEIAHTQSLLGRRKGEEKRGKKRKKRRGKKKNNRASLMKLGALTKRSRIARCH